MARSFVAAVTVAMALALAAAQVPVTSKFKFGEFFRGYGQSSRLYMSGAEVPSGSLTLSSAKGMFPRDITPV